MSKVGLHSTWAGLVLAVLSTGIPRAAHAQDYEVVRLTCGPGNANRVLEESQSLACASETLAVSFHEQVQGIAAS